MTAPDDSLLAVSLNLNTKWGGELQRCWRQLGEAVLRAQNSPWEPPPPQAWSCRTTGWKPEKHLKGLLSLSSNCREKQGLVEGGALLGVQPFHTMSVSEAEEPSGYSLGSCSYLWRTNMVFGFFNHWHFFKVLVTPQCHLFMIISKVGMSAWGGVHRGSIRPYYQTHVETLTENGFT